MTRATNASERHPDSAQVRVFRRALATLADGLSPAVSLYRPYVDGLENLPADGRFLIVGNHTQFMLAEILLIPYFVRKTIGHRVRTLADRRFGQTSGLAAALMAAYGAVVGSQEAAGDLMQENEPILVFPGGGREMPKFKGEEYTLRWGSRTGFARLAVNHKYPIVTAGLVGGDDVYTSVTTRDGRWGKISQWIGNRLAGSPDMAMPLVRGIGPTLIPRPQRMYLRFGPPIDTTRPPRTTVDAWTSTVKRRVQAQLEASLDDLQQIREKDPYRELNPAAWRSAVMP